jgi:hypothetical protein
VEEPSRRQPTERRKKGEEERLGRRKVCRCAKGKEASLAPLAPETQRKVGGGKAKKRSRKNANSREKTEFERGSWRRDPVYIVQGKRESSTRRSEEPRVSSAGSLGSKAGEKTE